MSIMQSIQAKEIINETECKSNGIWQVVVGSQAFLFFLHNTGPAILELDHTPRLHPYFITAEHKSMPCTFAFIPSITRFHLYIHTADYRVVRVTTADRRNVQAKSSPRRQPQPLKGNFQVLIRRTAKGCTSPCATRREKFWED